MKKQIIALLLLFLLLLPMFAGIRRIKRLPRQKPREDANDTEV
jgi:fumarate reductase subunit D